MENEKRTTNEFKTKNGHAIVIKDYITGREANAIQASYLKDAKVSIVNGAPQIENFDVSSDEKAKRVMFEMMVVTVDGKTEKIVDGKTLGIADMVLDLRNEDYEEIVEKLNEKTGKKKAE